MKQDKKQNIIYQIIRKYSFTLILIIIVFLFMVLAQLIIDNFNKTKHSISEVNNVISNSFRIDNQKLTILSRDLVKNDDLIEPYYAYFSMSEEDYRWWNLINSKGRENRDISLRFRNQMATDDAIQSIMVKLNDYDEVFFIEKGKYTGQKLQNYPNIKHEYKITKQLIKQNTFDVFGQVTFFLDDAPFLNAAKRNDRKAVLSVTILNNMNDVVFSYGQKDEVYDTFIYDVSVGRKTLNQIDETLDHHVYNHEYLVNGYKVITAASHTNIFVSIFFPMVLWVVAGLTMIFSLVYLLNRLFEDYMSQVDDVVEFVGHASVDSSDSLIALDNKEGEIYLISEAINDMLSKMRQYINDIYVLEIRQKDAELRALQAQINPHFMYNTLEYIRMNVVSEGLDELSEVIYSFASLLRNNIVAEKFVTLKNELSFCEKYVFLYQIRHPDRVAYKFEISSEMEKMVLPRFIIQPLIENYLIHGLDYRRFDNAISVSGTRSENKTTIIIKDNGKGMSEEKMSHFKALLENEQNTEAYTGDSIGILNVHERLKHYYKGKASMRLAHNEPSGLIVTIEIQEGE